VALNAAPAQALPDELLNTLDLLIVNEGELFAIAGGEDVRVDGACCRTRKQGRRAFGEDGVCRVKHACKSSDIGLEYQHHRISIRESA
jgi:sugar/nucleoside kinase (ribokinase family)